jgi:hypothetical protein
MEHPMGVWFEILKVCWPCFHFQCCNLSRIDTQHALYHKVLWRPPKGTQGRPWATPWESWFEILKVFVFSAENWENWYPTWLDFSEILSGPQRGPPAGFQIITKTQKHLWVPTRMVQNHFKPSYGTNWIISPFITLAITAQSRTTLTTLKL